jgi:methionine-rich copper-binding protein CopC
MMSRYLIRIGVLFVSTVLTDPVWAHAILVRSTPAQDAAVTQAPEKVELWFNEGVGNEYAALAVIDSSGARVDGKDAQRGTLDPSYLSVSLPKVAAGTYTVRYRVLSADGHVVSGKYNFVLQSSESAK